MAWTTPPTFTADTPISQSRAQILSDDLSYVFAVPASEVARNPGADYTTTSAAWADIDSTNLSLTVTTAGTRLKIGYTGGFYGDAARLLRIDFTVDGTRIGNATNGAAQHNLSTSVATLSGTFFKTGLTPGSHTIKIQWKGPGIGTITAQASVCPLWFWVEEY